MISNINYKNLAMTGLRERNKVDRTRRMLESAAHLFRETGYDPARMEDIAARAEVSVGTLYNYFATKGDLLLAIVSMEVEEVLAAGDAVVRNPAGRAEDALNALVGGYYDHSLVYLSKDMWRQAIALSIGAPGTPLSQRYIELDGMLSAQVCDLMRAFQARGLVASTFDPAAMGTVIFNNLNALFVGFVTSDDMTMADLQTNVRFHHGAIMQVIARAPNGFAARAIG